MSSRSQADPADPFDEKDIYFDTSELARVGVGHVSSSGAPHASVLIPLQLGQIDGQTPFGMPPATWYQLPTPRYVVPQKEGDQCWDRLTVQAVDAEDGAAASAGVRICVWRVELELWPCGPWHGLLWP